MPNSTTHPKLSFTDPSATPSAPVSKIRSLQTDIKIQVQQTKG